MVKLTPIVPTPTMIEDGAQRLVSWEEGCVWPDSWDSLQVAAARNDAERVWRSMWLAAAPSPEWVNTNERLPEHQDADENGDVWAVNVKHGTVYPVHYCEPLDEYAWCSHWMPKPRQTPPAPPTEAPVSPTTEGAYNELIMAVGNKHPGETRHQTALRYIQQAERPTEAAESQQASDRTPQAPGTGVSCK